MSQPIQGQQSDPNTQQQSAGGSGAGTTGPTGTDGNQGGQQSGQSSQGNQTGQQDQGQSEVETLRTKLSHADRRAQEAERKLQEAERAKMDEGERTKAELADAQQALEAQKKINSELSLKVAFLEDNSYSWKNPKAALKLADLDGVEVKEDGTVTGLKAALDKLAKSDPYLLNETKSSSEGEGDGQGQGQQSGGQSGQQSGGVTPPPMNNGNSTNNDRNSLASRFPQITGRVG